MSLAILTFRTADEALCPDEILERLRGEFESVSVDAEVGREHAQRELDLLRAMNAPREVIEFSERGVAAAQWVTVRDGGASFEFMLTPEGNIRIDHDEPIDSLVRRCAVALDCHLEHCG